MIWSDWIKTMVYPEFLSSVPLNCSFDIFGLLKIYNGKQRVPEA